MSNSPYTIWNGKLYPYVEDGIFKSKDITFTANNTTASEICFTVTGTVLIKALWGEVTTAIGSNHTAAHFRLNDQTAQIALTEAVTGATLSSFAAGSAVFAWGAPTATLEVKNASVGFTSNAFDLTGSSSSKLMVEILVGKKSGALTQIEYRYTTTNAPTSGAMRVYCKYVPLSADGALA